MRNDNYSLYNLLYILVLHKMGLTMSAADSHGSTQIKKNKPTKHHASWQIRLAADTKYSKNDELLATEAQRTTP
jgi:hypothetical protein